MSDISERIQGGSGVTTLETPAVATDVAAAALPVVGPTDAQSAIPFPGRMRGRLERLGWYLARPLVFLRYLLRKALWIVIRITRSGWRHPIVALLVIIAVGLGYQGYNSYIEDEPPPPASEVFDIAPAIPPPSIADSFFSAQRAYDGGAIWDLLPEETKTNLLSQGVTKQIYAQRFANLQVNGVNFGESEYVGGVEGSDSVMQYFYVTALPLGNGQVTSIYQVLFVNRESGEFLGWDDPLPEELMSTMSQ